MTNKRGQSIAKSAFFVSAMMILFKIFGFVKQAVVAYYFGATVESDTYFIAWGFVSGVLEAIVKALGVSLVAVYTGLRIREGKEQASNLINGLLELLFPVFLIIAGLVCIFSSSLASVLAASYTGEKGSLLAHYLAVLSPVFLFGSFELVFRSVLASHKSFYIPRLHSFIYSSIVILCCVYLSSTLGIKALVISQYASNIVYTILLLTNVHKYHQFRFVSIKKIPELKTLMLTAIPLIIGNSALELNQMVDKSITSGLGAGAASSLSYCHTLEQLVTNIMIVNIGNVMFAHFAEFVAQDRIGDIQKTLSKTIDTLICCLLGISIITVFCSKDIVSIVYLRGKFTENATLLTSTALIGYALSFPAVAVRDITIKSMYAFKDTKHPMIASFISIAINITLSLILSKHIGILGISVATSISAYVGMMINAHFFKKHVDYRYQNHLKTVIRCVPGCIVMASICYAVRQFAHSGYISRLVISSVFGTAAFIAVSYLFNVEPVTNIIRICKSKLGNLTSLRKKF